MQINDGERPALRIAPMAETTITGEALIRTLQEMPDTVGGFDQWVRKELQTLAKWFPALFDALAALLELVEDTGVWAQSNVDGYISQI